MPWQTVDPVPADRFAEIRRTAIFECCKWDPQVEDVCALSPQPIVLTTSAWKELVKSAEQLARETCDTEQELLNKPGLWRELGLPWALRRGLAKAADAEREHLHFRFVRFDFHFTPDGWRISETNCDVPGGFNEASGFTRLMAAHFSRCCHTGDPALALADAIRARVETGSTVALVHATAFTDDRQVMVYLARHLEAAGLKAMLISPDHLRWDGARPFLATDWSSASVDFVFRFFPAEWLPALPRDCGWRHLLGNSRVPLCNPGSAILTQSKRFPLVWDRLETALPTWRALLPRTFDPRRIPDSIPSYQRVHKSAFGRVGDMIRIEGVTPPKEARKIERAVRWNPRNWIVQERFTAVAMHTVAGDVYPCIGIYTLNGRVIGAYGRIARRPLIDHLAQDAAVLVADEPHVSNSNRIVSNDPLRILQNLGA